MRGYGRRDDGGKDGSSFLCLTPNIKVYFFGCLSGKGLSDKVDTFCDTLIGHCKTHLSYPYVSIFVFLISLVTRI